MEKELEQLQTLNKMLLLDMPQYEKQAALFDRDIPSQWRLFRSLVNMREAAPISEKFLTLQNAYLKQKTAQKKITDMESLLPIQENLYLWQGDITALKVDGIVNAANSGLTGCYCPCHGCIDNAIHTFAGVQLRLACDRLMKEQGYPEPTGRAKITKGYNLPCKYVLHTVGPIVKGKVSLKDCRLLASCYESCLLLAEKYQIKSLAFSCISTGEFHFPKEKAAETAIEAIKKYLKNHKDMKIVCNVFSKKDYQIYERLLR